MIPDRARVVIVGAGIAGSSIALHLTRLGWSDVLVLDAGELVGGTTSHAPGLVGQLRSSVSLTRMLMHSTALYRTLSDGGVPGFEPVGSLRLASSLERMVELRRQEGFARGVGLEAHLLETREAIDLVPFLDPTDLLGALYLPTDGSASAPVLARAAIAESEAAGARFVPHTPVTGLVLERGRVTGVETPAGTIAAEQVVIAAGIWSAMLARMAGVDLPLTPMQHQYAVTGPLAVLEGRSVPNARDPDNLVYIRQRGDALVAGGYERTPQVYSAGRIGHGPNPTILRFDPEQFASLRAALGMRFPLLRDAAWAEEVNGLESFTPDGEFLLGPSATVGGLWFACGFCAHGVSGAGGVGRVIAEWLVDGTPSLDLWHMDVRRFGGYASGGSYVRDRAREVYATYYDILYPGHERASARGLRLSPAAPELEMLGVSWGEKAGWERPNWFTPNVSLVASPWTPRGWPARHYSPAIEAEHRATRDRAGLFDFTSFSKIEVGGPGAVAFLQHLAAGDLDRPIGAIVYTQLLDERGGIECDVTVTRLEADRFRIITGTAFGTHDLQWICSHLPDDGSVYALDVTSSLCCFGLWGPLARDILSSVVDDDLSNEAFPYLTARPIAVGPIPVFAQRVTYVGELGWELYAPMEYGRALWTVLWTAAEPHGALPVGYRAVESLRLEKGYRYWSTDIHSEYTPFEAGLGFAVRMKKGAFMGREALVRQRAEGMRRRLCCLTLADRSAVCLGNEPLLMNGQVVGRVTSGGYGYSVGESIAYGYLPPTLTEPGTRLEVLWFGEGIQATVVREPLYDPSNHRIKEVIPAAIS
jgi:glycine cleavage system aminomethyltransferase T/glycine/D-amino acid oxidase-like deaminating enzyme